MIEPRTVGRMTGLRRDIILAINRGIRSAEALARALKPPEDPTNDPTWWASYHTRPMIEWGWLVATSEDEPGGPCYVVTAAGRRAVAAAKRKPKRGRPFATRIKRTP